MNESLFTNGIFLTLVAVATILTALFLIYIRLTKRIKTESQTTTNTLKKEAEDTRKEVERMRHRLEYKLEQAEKELEIGGTE